MNKFIAIILFFLFLLQFSFFSMIGFEMNFILAFVLILAQRRFDFSGITWIFICGLFFDIFSAQMFGVNIISFILVALLVNFANSFFVAFESNRVVNGVVYLAGKIFFDLVKYFLGAIFVLIRIEEFNFLKMPEIFSFNYLLGLIFFTIITSLLLIVYEKLEKISGEKREELRIHS